MKSEELRIGNLITNGKDIIEVKIISNNGFAAMVNYMPLEDYDYRSINLTEEWLFKYNFKKHDNDYYSLDDSWIDFNDMGHWDFRVSYKYEFYVQIKYVHQLQNLYFALTGNELTL